MLSKIYYEPWFIGIVYSLPSGCYKLISLMKSLLIRDRRIKHRVFRSDGIKNRPESKSSSLGCAQTTLSNLRICLSKFLVEWGYRCSNHAINSSSPSWGTNKSWEETSFVNVEQVQKTIKTDPEMRIKCCHFGMYNSQLFIYIYFQLTLRTHSKSN